MLDFSFLETQNEVAQYVRYNYSHLNKYQQVIIAMKILRVKKEMGEL